MTDLTLYESATIAFLTTTIVVVISWVIIIPKLLDLISYINTKLTNTYFKLGVWLINKIAKLFDINVNITGP